MNTVGVDRLECIALDPRSQKGIWEYMRKDSIIRLLTKDEASRRVQLLVALKKEVAGGAYSPRPIHGFLSAPKANGVPRFIPVLSWQDVAVYFGCIKAFDQRIAELAVEGTFGGWALGGKRRQIEEEQAAAMMDASVPGSSYNRWAWVQNWQQFWKLTAATFEQSAADSHFAMFDIANFYDTIDLPRLERELRKFCPDQTGAIDVLMRLLKDWNKGLNQYAPATKGIPMDIVGDCSRLLANFYLTPFDRAIKEESESRNSRFMRFADDMVLCCPDRTTCNKLVYFAAGILHSIGLNINVSKVKYLNKNEFEAHWGFGILDGFESGAVFEDLMIGSLRELQSRWYDKSFERGETALKRAIGLLVNFPEFPGWRKWVCKVAFESEDFILKLNERQMRNLIGLSVDKKEALVSLASRVLEFPFTQPKAFLLRCLEGFLSDKDNELSELARRFVSDISNLDDQVLNLAIKNTPEPRMNRRSKPEGEKASVLSAL